MNPEIKKILEQFSYDFNSTYQYMTGPQKRTIAHLSPTLFARWYYSALFPETILSPAVILSSQRENVILDKGFYSTNMHFKNINSDTLDFLYSENFYSVEDHPIYKDLESLLEYINPILYIDSDGNMYEKDVRALQRKLSISDRYYVIYLFDLAKRLSLTIQMPSLFDNCIQPNSENVFLKLPNSTKLDRIIDESCSLCADNINAEIPFEFMEVTSEMIYNLLINPIPIDDIFMKLYQNSDINLEEIWSMIDSSELSDTDSAILSSVFYIGIYFDKAFIFVFGSYLRIIQPIYSFPIKFRDVINALFNSITVDRECDTEIFIPCTTYTQTILGKLLFSSSNTKIKSYPLIPIDKILHSLDKESAKSVAETESFKLYKESQSIYTFKAILNGNKSLWKKIEIEKGTLLNTAAKHVFLMFLLPEEKEYTIKINNNGKETAQYIHSTSDSKYSSASAKIGDIIPSVGKSITFSLVGNQSIELKFMGIKEICHEILYPRITSQSREITEMENKIYYLDF